MSTPGESYEQWRERTAPGQQVKPVDTRPWDVGVIGLLGVFFLWVGGTTGWVGLGLVAVLVAELLFQRSVTSRTENATADRPAANPTLIRVRGATLVLTLGLSVWLVVESGGEAAPLPLLLVLLDVKDDRSVLRWVLSRRRRSP